jgi:PadR family transcriptional regulator PadR
MPTNELIKGTLGTIILKLLQENGKMYGYDITKVVKQRTDGKILLKEGSLYPALHKLLKEGFVKTEEVMVGNRPRVYYSLTPSGKKQIAVRAEELSVFMESIQMIMGIKMTPSHG